MEEHKKVNILVLWRGNKLNVEINSGVTLKEFGHKLQLLTNVQSDTIRLLISRSSDNSSKLLTPFSDDHSILTLKESSILEAKSIRMMGVFKDEIEQVSQNGSKEDLRIAGFDEEERRLQQRMLNRPKYPLKLPHGAYIFCDFRTLHLPGVELSPPPSEALKRMHMLAADPGIIAIMNKYHWRVGIMTEMAPVGYVGVSPKCILGFNKNRGEEISLRLRTDDLKGFRKYQSIKKTLLHELAHMVYSEHDAKFYALEKQLNQEAASLDWTRSKSHTLSGLRRSNPSEEDFSEETSSSSQKLGGKRFDGIYTARSTSVAAAYRRFVAVSTDNVKENKVDFEPDPDESVYKVRVDPDLDDSFMQVELPSENDDNAKYEPDHDMEDQNKFDDHEALEMESYSGTLPTKIPSEINSNGREKATRMPLLPINGRFVGLKPPADEPDPDDSEVTKTTVFINGFAEPINGRFVGLKPPADELDPDDSEVTKTTVFINGFAEPDPDDSVENKNLDDKTQSTRVPQDFFRGNVHMQGSLLGCRNFSEPNPDDLLCYLEDSNIIQETPYPENSELKHATWECGNNVEPDPDDIIPNKILQHDDLQVNQSGDSITKINQIQKLPEPDNNRIPQCRPDLDEINEHTVMQVNIPYEESGSNDQELQRIQDPVSVICTRLQKSIEMLKSEVNPVDVSLVLQTLFKIIRNMIEHPGEIKFRRLRKANPHFDRNVGRYKAAMEILYLVGFREDTVSDEIGRVETYIVLKRNDPGLLWIVKSSLETYIAAG